MFTSGTFCLEFKAKRNTGRRYAVEVAIGPMVVVLLVTVAVIIDSINIIITSSIIVKS